MAAKENGGMLKAINAEISFKAAFLEVVQILGQGFFRRTPHGCVVAVLLRVADVSDPMVSYAGDTAQRTGERAEEIMQG